MVISPALTLLLGNDLLKDVFKAVVKDRTIRFKDLRESFSPSAVAPGDLKTSLDLLKQNDLIKELPSPIHDFATYYVTADGLMAERGLKRAEPSDKEAATPVAATSPRD